MRGKSGIKLFNEYGKFKCYITPAEARQMDKDELLYRFVCLRCQCPIDTPRACNRDGGNHRWGAQEKPYQEKQPREGMRTWKTANERPRVLSGKWRHAGPGRPHQTIVSEPKKLGKTRSQWKVRSNGFPDRMKVDYRESERLKSLEDVQHTKRDSPQIFCKGSGENLRTYGETK